MALKVPSVIHRYVFWFYVRTLIFQGVFPIVMGVITFYDLTKQQANQEIIYNVYFYTAMVLFIYSSIKSLLDFIFAVCADDIIFKKEVDLTSTTRDLVLSLRLDDGNPSSSHMIIVKKIFKPRFSSSWFFIFVMKLCWTLGLDCPILLPSAIVDQFLDRTKLSINEEALLNTTLDFIFQFKADNPHVRQRARQPSSYIARQLDNHGGYAKLTDPDDVMKKSILDVKRQLCDDFRMDINLPDAVV